MKTKAEEAKLPKLLSDNYRMVKLKLIFGWLKSFTNKMKNLKNWQQKKVHKEEKSITRKYFERFFEEFEKSKQRKRTEKKIEKTIMGKFLTMWVFEMNSRRNFL